MTGHFSMQNLEPKAPPPSFIAFEDDPRLPRVLLLGDSISMGYTLATRELLRGKANVHRPATNCGPTARGVELLDQWLGNRNWDVIHFNFGLHDLKYADGKGDLVSVEAGKQLAAVPVYEANLREIAARLQKIGARLIWASTTPVPEGAHGRVANSEANYNAAAARVMEQSGIATNDLRAVAAARIAEYQLSHDVHFNAAGSQALAAAVAASIEAALLKMAQKKD